jgi:hypothetical protein
MEHSSFWESNMFSASQQIPCIIFTPYVHYRIKNAQHMSLSWASSPRISIPFSRACVVKRISPIPRLCACNIISFYREHLLAPRPKSDIEYHPLSAVRECLFHTFAATLHIWWSLFLYPQTEDAPCGSGTDGAHVTINVVDRGPSLLAGGQSEFQISSSFSLNSCSTAVFTPAPSRPQKFHLTFWHRSFTFKF